VRHPILVFDAYGTLFDVHSAVARYRSEIGPRSDQLSQIWRTKQLEYSWVRSLCGAYRDFEALTAEALDFAALSCGGLTPALRSNLMDAYMRLEAYPDVRPTLEALHGRGAKTAILSNGTIKMLEAACRSTDLRHLIGAILSVDRIKVFKTDKRVYDMVGVHFGCEPAQVSFQSSNRWDVAAAAHYGFHAVWINRTQQIDEYTDQRPARVLPSLASLLDD
jgi:2-haloacid dehalogenase